MRLLREALASGSILLDVDALDIESALRITLDSLVADARIPAQHRDEVESTLLEREGQFSTAIGNSVAIPHAYLDVLSEPIIVFVRLARPINLGAPDGIPARFMFLLLGPTGTTADHLESLAAIARLMSNDEFRYEAASARTETDLVAALDGFLARTTIVPREEADRSTEGLNYTGRLFGGLRDDVRRRGAKYISDFRDGLSPKCFSSTLFLFFACLAPAVTFGGIMGAQTDGQIGVVEMLVASAACGIAYALFSVSRWSSSVESGRCWCLPPFCSDCAATYSFRFFLRTRGSDSGRRCC